MLLLRLSQGISLGWHNATTTPKYFRNCHYCGKAALCFCFDVAKVFLQDSTTPPLHPFFGNIIILGSGHYASASTWPGYFFRVPPRQPYSNIFLNCHYFEKWALSFRFDLAKVFLQGATMLPIHHFFEIVIIVGTVPYPPAST